MASLEIRFLNGDVETRELAKNQPVSIGRNPSNDISVDEDDVGILHCRISWNRDHYEVTAAGLDGVELNGAAVRHSTLKPGDIIRVGTLDIAYVDAEFAAGQSSRPGATLPTSGPVKKDPFHDMDAKSDEFGGLKPLTEDEIRKEERERAETLAANAELRRKAEGKTEKKPEAKSSHPSKSKPASVPPPRRTGPVSVADLLLEEDEAEDDSDARSAKGSSSRDQAGNRPPLLKRGEYGSAKPEENEDDGPMLRRGSAFAKGEGGDSAGDGKTAVGGAATKLAEKLNALRSRPVRPGEQDTLRSPFVLGMGGTAAVLLLAAATFWFIIGRDKAQRQYDAATRNMQEGKFAQAIEGYEEFLKVYYRHKLTNPARAQLGKARVEQKISGATPDWSEGLETLKKFIAEQREGSTFADVQADARSYAERITLGAVKSADTQKNRSLLEIASNAFVVTESLPVAEGDESGAFGPKYQAAVDEAEKSLRKWETKEAAKASMKSAIAAKQPIQALKTRLAAIQQYPDFSTDRELMSLLNSSLETERGLVTHEAIGREGLNTEVPLPPRQLGGPTPIVFHTRAQTIERSDGRTVHVIAKDALVGVDAITGEPLWRRTTGFDQPFFPVEVPSTPARLLVFNTRSKEIQLIDLRTGKLHWRQRLSTEAGASQQKARAADSTKPDETRSETPAGPPLIHEGEIFVATRERSLYQLDLETGRAVARLRFSQPLHAPPIVPSSGKFMVLLGERELAYRVSLRPLRCESVSHIGQSPDGIAAPILSMGHLLLFTDNDRQSSALLRVLDAHADKKQITELASARVEGQIRDRPLLHGNQLFVASSGERISAFAVDDDRQQTPLKPIGRFQDESNHTGPMFLRIATDGQIWMASGALRRFQLKSNSIQGDVEKTGLGQATQPLQEFGANLFLARRLPWNTSTVLTQVDRRRMTSQWRAVAGAKIIAWQIAPEGRVVCLTESGDIFRLDAAALKSGKIVSQSSGTIRLTDDLKQPLQAMPLRDGRIAAFSGGEEPSVWFITPLGTVERRVRVNGYPEAPPVELGKYLVLPIPGRLSLVPLTASTAAGSDFLAPAGRERATRWKSVVATDESHLVAVTAANEMIRFQLQTAAKPTLASTATVMLPRPVDNAPVSFGSQLAVGDAAGTIRIYDASRLDVVAELPLDGSAISSLYVLPGNTPPQLLVESGGSKLICISTDKTVVKKWTADLSGESTLASGPRLIDGTLVVARRDGKVISLDPIGGKVLDVQDAGASIDSGPLRSGLAENEFVVLTTDGTILRFGSPSAAAKQADVPTATRFVANQGSRSSSGRSGQ